MDGEKVDLYAGVARQLFSNLFDLEPDEIFIRTSSPQDFISRYIELETCLREAIISHGLEPYTGSRRMMGVSQMLKILVENDLVSVNVVNEIRSLSQVRNQFVHGMEAPSSRELEELNSRLWKVLVELRNNL